MLLCITYVEEIFGTGNRGKPFGISAAKGVCTCDDIGKCTCETKVYTKQLKQQKNKIDTTTPMTSIIFKQRTTYSKLKTYINAMCILIST